LNTDKRRDLQLQRV